MNYERPFVRKLIYGSIIVVLMLVLAWLSPPSTVETPGAPATGGGLLAQKRTEYHLNQANIGEIDPTSETIKLATLGLRGVAVNLLWSKANEAQKTRDWTTLSATVSQIIKLQPNFVAVWRFQGWNLAYNVSADWDDYRDRYAWVIRGINFLKDGTNYNKQEPILVWDIGWFTSQKIGRADERVQYRRLFRDDDDFHGDRPVSERDNWLVGQLSFRQAEAMVDSGIPLGGIRELLDPDAIVTGKSPLLFRADAPRCQINYAGALEEDGTFGEVARVAWADAARQWDEFGDKDIPSLEPTIKSYRLDDFDRALANQQRLNGQLEELAPGILKRLIEERHAALSEPEKELFAIPEQKRTREDRARISAIEYKIEVSPRDVAQAIEDETRRKRALEVADEILANQLLLRELDISRTQVAYPYWVVRCRCEQTAPTLTTRQALFTADRAYREANLLAARTNYELAFENWRQVLDEFPSLKTDGLTAEELLDGVRRYRECLKQLDQPFPKPFVLDDLMDEFSGYLEFGN